MPEKLTKEIFICRSEKIHGNKYGYLLVDYKNIKTKVEIYCNSCLKSFWQRPECHMIGQGCPDCGLIESATKRRRTNADFINDAHKIHTVGRYGQVFYYVWTEHSDLNLEGLEEFNVSKCFVSEYVHIRKPIAFEEMWNYGSGIK